MRTRRGSAIRAIGLLALLLPTVAQADDAEPFRLTRALDTPPWLRLAVEQRSRVEHTENTFFAGGDADPTALAMRTLVAIEASSDPAALVVELIDARTYADADTRLNTTHVDPLELLQAHVALRPKDVFLAGDRAEIRFGRMTIDLGSRRLVARNDFRNTINAFTGIDTRWSSPAQHGVRAFAVLPVLRQPGTDPAMRENRVELDRENVHALLWAVAYESPAFRGTTGELYAVGLHERDSASTPNPHRQLVTPGVRVLRRPRPGSVDFQLEAAVQTGRSRASAMATDDLDHLAYTWHAQIGFKLRAPGELRIAVHHDHASGDRDRDDGKNQRFDTLFGARRFEFGPTGTYGALSRSNLISPALRLEAQPHPRLEAMAMYRLMWLASIEDAWVPAGLHDPAAGSRFVGQQLEGRLRWQAIPKNLGVELGGARLIRGAFARDATDGRRAPASYLYLQLTTTL
jgi:hypothetical protein